MIAGTAPSRASEVSLVGGHQVQFMSARYPSSPRIESSILARSLSWSGSAST